MLISTAMFSKTSKAWLIDGENKNRMQLRHFFITAVKTAQTEIDDFISVFQQNENLLQPYPLVSCINPIVSYRIVRVCCFIVRWSYPFVRWCFISPISLSFNFYSFFSVYHISQWIHFKVESRSVRCIPTIYRIRIVESYPALYHIIY